MLIRQAQPCLYLANQMRWAVGRFFSKTLGLLFCVWTLILHHLHSTVSIGIMHQRTALTGRALKLHSKGPTSDIVITPEGHFNVVPLHDHAALCGWGSDGHVDIVLIGEGVHWQRLCGHWLMEDKVWTERMEDYQIYYTALVPQQFPEYKR